MEKLKTPKEKSYWADTGAYQKQYKLITETLVPGHGKADTKHGELVRIIDNFSHDFYTNDGENYIDKVKCDCPECNGTGWEVTNWRDKDEPDYEEEKDDCSYCGGDCTIVKKKEFNREFEDEFDYLKDNLPHTVRPVLDEFEKFVLDDGGNEDVFERLIDEMMYHILTTENEPR